MLKKTINFAEENLLLAIQAVNDGMLKKGAARQFGVSRSTLQFRLKNPIKKMACGSPIILTEVEEYTLVKWILESSRKGFPRRKKDLQLSVKKFLDDDKRRNPFNDNMPDTYYFANYLWIN